MNREHGTARKVAEKRAAGTIFYALIWVVLSSAVILYNKYILTVINFPFPILLTTLHMACSAALTAVLVRLRGHDPRTDVLNARAWLTYVFPIAVLFAASLWLGNAAYLYLSISFVQIIKVRT
jgi:lysylphosphatidylglycerol synthetase-like protein (DUF2156 family)